MDKVELSKIIVTPLGAGRDVGRSCLLLQMGGKNIMLDCGLHMGMSGPKRFPDFNFITLDRPCSVINCVLITHFHLDHCGALPYFTEIIGFNGPVYMSNPTKAISPILIEDMRKVSVDRKGELCMFTSQQIKDCMKKVITINLHQNVQVDKDIQIKAYYAGHVLGAVMFWIKVGDQTVVYTGDYNMTPDRHLGAAWIDKCRPDLLITESTYATTIRDSKRCRERDFLKNVHECIDRGGKILIPVFALGRAQELCILLDTYWERMNIKAPIYFAAGLTEKGNNYYKLFITWTNQKIKNTFVNRNMFDFRHIKPFDKSYINNPGPMVVFATPGMLHAGLSLQLFKKWAPNENNLLIMPGFCVKGTVGHKVVQGAKKVYFERKVAVDVKLGVEYMSFSAHADAKGIMQLIQYCEPKNVMLVHGEGSKMKYLRQKIQLECDNMPVFMPRNGQTCIIDSSFDINLDISTKLLKTEATKYNSSAPNSKKPRIIHGVLVVKRDTVTLMDVDEACKEAGIKRHTIRFTSTVKLRDPGPTSKTASKLYKLIKDHFDEFMVQLTDHSISIESVLIKIEGGENEQKSVYISWTNQDEELGSTVLEVLQKLT